MRKETESGYASVCVCRVCDREALARWRKTWPEREILDIGGTSGWKRSELVKRVKRGPASFQEIHGASGQIIYGDAKLRVSLYRLRGGPGDRARRRFTSLAFAARHVGPLLDGPDPRLYDDDGVFLSFFIFVLLAAAPLYSPPRSGPRSVEQPLRTAGRVDGRRHRHVFYIIHGDDD